MILQKLAKELHVSQTPVIIETAGGVHSPAPSGSSQLELYRPFRLPVVLVADSKLGGISTTMAAYESLRLHGFDVVAIVGFKAEWGNLPYLSTKLAVPIVQLPPPPVQQADPEEDAENMSVYYDVVAKSSIMSALKQELEDAHAARVARLREMPDLALSTLWYPFTQHSHLSPAGVTTIDSALGDDFATFDADNTALRPVFDGSASWWTQGLGHGNVSLALEAAHAASRYGHVILPNAVNEPALALAERLLRTVGRGWASRVYYSDNGSTAMEVALKMALKASRVRYGDGPGSKESLALGVIGLTGSYHGDTIGAMDASDPNIFNEQVDWYQARGLFFDPPSLLMRKGVWELTLPAQSRSDDNAKEDLDVVKFASLREIFDLTARKTSNVAHLYESWIKQRIATALARGQKFGALVFEPMLMGAGGMVFVDPLFQHLLVNIVRSSSDLCPSSTATYQEGEDSWTGLPVITDEVFVGLYRLSQQRTFEALDILPDISVNAKLLTGGAVPLATTMARESIFEAFYRDEKRDALLHGHSYTAHPIGTSVALKSLEILDHIHDPAPPSSSSSSSSSSSIERDEMRARRTAWSRDEPFYSVWEPEFITRLSHHAKIDGVLCLGSVMAITLRVDGVAAVGGYGSTVATSLVTRLRAAGSHLSSSFPDNNEHHDRVDESGEGHARGVMVRPLGNVVYFMASQVTTSATAREIQNILLRELDAS